MQLNYRAKYYDSCLALILLGHLVEFGEVEDEVSNLCRQRVSRASGTMLFDGRAFLLSAVCTADTALHCPQQTPAGSSSNSFCSRRHFSFGFSSFFHVLAADPSGRTSSYSPNFQFHDYNTGIRFTRKNGLIFHFDSVTCVNYPFFDCWVS